MSYGRVACRQAVATYFANAAIPYVGTVYPARPEVMGEEAYTQTMLGQAVATTPNGSSSVLVVNIPTTTRQRKADTGRGAVNDTVINDVVMEVFFASTGGRGIEAQQDYDTIIDSLTQAIRDDPTMGGQLWSAGEYQDGISHEQSEPQLNANGLTIYIIGTLRFQAWQWAAGNVTPLP